ncbi:MAG: PHP domain-containing protein [Candidatus Izimaplasma sp.]|nr:PHP domain-containing protein [Candidatus Izimaplasma bacterium]
MTPNNILNMAMLKGIDFLAITDHNTTKQLKIVEELEDSYDFIFIPGVEVTVEENFDVLCFFKSFNDALIFDNYLEKNLDGDWGIFNKSDQVLTDIYDVEVATYNKPLTSTKIPYKDLVKAVRNLDGLIVLCHIDRSSKSVLNVYKLDNLEFDAIEISSYVKEKYLIKHPELLKYKILCNSDAHTLLSMSEKDYFFELEEKSLDSFFKFLRSDIHE